MDSDTIKDFREQFVQNATMAEAVCEVLDKVLYKAATKIVLKQFCLMIFLATGPALVSAFYDTSMLFLIGTYVTIPLLLFLLTITFYAAFSEFDEYSKKTATTKQMKNSISYISWSLVYWRNNVLYNFVFYLMCGFSLASMMFIGYNTSGLTITLFVIAVLTVVPAVITKSVFDTICRKVIEPLVK